MAHRLQKVVAASIVLGAAGLAQSQPFSHKVHIKLVSECISCHTQAATSSAASDNLKPDASACANCHEKVEIGPPLGSLVVKFSHRQHLQMGNLAPVIAGAVKSGKYLGKPEGLLAELNTKNACVACHRGLESSDQVSKASDPAMADCLVCHNRIDPPFTCTTCHAPDAQLMPADHVRGFLELHATGKAQIEKTTCAVCHGTNVTCGGCH